MKYRRAKQYAHLSDEEILAVLLLADQLADQYSLQTGVRFELHPGEKELVESFLREPEKLAQFLRGLEENRTEVLRMIIRLLNRPVRE